MLGVLATFLATTPILAYTLWYAQVGYLHARAWAYKGYAEVLKYHATRR